MGNFNKGDKVYFGRHHGEKTLGEIVKVNSKTYKIRQLEERGVQRSRPAGTIWNVAKEFVTSATSHTPENATVSRLASEPARSDAVILREIAGIYSALSPENLSCDGELPPSMIRRTEAALRRRLETLFTELGRRVSEEETF